MKITRKQLRQIINEELSSIIETVDEKSVGNYCIRKGDSIASVTDRHSPKGVTWQMNAKLNDLKAPYTIHPKDNLKIWVTPDYEGEANCPQVKPPPVNEAMMVSLKPIISMPPSTMESRWAKLSGIPEEHINLSETVVDTGLFDAAIRNAITAWQEVSDQFGDSMMMIWEEDPAMMSNQGYKDKSEWQQQVTYAQKELGDAFSLEKIEAKIQEVESMLHGGQFYDERDSRSSMGGRDSNNDGALDADELRDIADDLEG